MYDEDYVNAAIKHIINLEQQANSNPNINIHPNTELNPEQILINSILDPRRLKIKGTYLIDSQGNEVPYYEKFKGTVLGKEGYPVDLHKEYFYPLDDGTTMGEVTECQTCGSIIHKDNMLRCACGITCCVLCGIYSNKTQMYYCCTWHKIQDGGGLF